MSIVSHFHFILSIASIVGFIVSVLVFIVKVCFKIEACTLYYKVLLFLLLNGSNFGCKRIFGPRWVNPRHYLCQFGEMVLVGGKEGG
jgi:hypothetical protein